MAGPETLLYVDLSPSDKSLSGERPRGSKSRSPHRTSSLSLSAEVTGEEPMYLLMAWREVHDLGGRQGGRWGEGKEWLRRV